MGNPIKPMTLTLLRDVRYRAESHGHAEHDHGTLVLGRGSPVVLVGPSKVPGHVVINADDTFIRVKADAVRRSI